MTKFLRKVFVCGVLLSSVSAYCENTGIVTELYPKLEDGKLTLAESSVTINQNATANNDIIIGAQGDGLSLVTNENGTVLQATDFTIAKTDDGKVWRYFDGDSALDVIPVGGGNNAIYKTYGSSNQYICLASDTTGSENKLYEKFSDNKWYMNTTSDDLTEETVAGATEVKVVDLNETDTSYSLATTGEKPDLLFTGILATKDSGGAWTLSDGTTPLPGVKLEVNSGKTLTIGDKQVEDDSHSGAMKNNASATLTFTEFGSLQGPGSVILLNDDYSTPGDPSTQIQWATTAVFEPGSKAGASGSPVSISGGTTDLGQYLQKEDKVTGNDAEGAKLNLTIDGNVDVFSGIVPSTAQASDKSAAIDLFNESSVSGVFQGISGTFNVDVPYTYNVGSTAYNSIVDLVPNVSAEDKVSLNIASKAKVGGLFSGSSTITYTMNGKPTENLSALVDETIAYAHDISGDTTKTVFLDVSSVKNFDNTFKSDEYFYSGPAGTKAVNVIPLDVDAYVIPDTGENPDGLASTSLSSNVINKYLEPNMATKTGSVSTELSVGQDKTKTLLMNEENNNVNTGKGPNLTLTDCDLKVKSKNGDAINRNTLTLKNSKAILSGTNTVQNINMDSNSTLRIRGTFNWGTTAV